MNNKKYSTILFCVVSSLYSFSLYTYVPILPAYSESLGASYKLIGIVIGSYGFTQMLCRIPIGIFSDAINSRKIFIIIGLFASLTSSLGMWYSTNITSLIVFRSLSGIASATWAIFAVLFASYFDDHNVSKSIGILNSFDFFSMVSALLIGSIVSHFFNQKYNFLLASAASLTALLLSFFISEKKDEYHTPIRFSLLMETLKDRNLIITSIVAMTLQFITFSTIYGFTPLFAKSIGANDIQIGMLSTIFNLPGILASAMSGTYFAKKFGEKKTIVLGYTIITLSCFLTPLINKICIFYIIQFVGGFGRHIVYSLLMALCIKNVKYQQRGTAMGIYQAIFALGTFIGPIIVGFLIDTTSLSFGFIATGLVGVIGIFIFWHYIKAI